MSIKIRIILLVIVPVLLGLTGAGILSATTSLESATENMNRQSDIANMAYSEALTQSIGRYSAQVEAMAREAGFFDPDTTEQDKVRLLQRHAATTDVANIGIFGADGKNIFIAYEDGTTVPVGVADISARSYLPEALSGKTVVFGPSKDVVTGRLTITIATRSIAPGAPPSIVALDFELDFANDMVAEAQYGTTGYSFLVDREGMIIAHPDSALISNSYKELAEQDSRYASINAAVEAALASAGSGNINFEFEGEENYATYSQVEGTDGWIMVSTALVSEYLEGYNNSVKTQIIVLAAFLAVAVIFALFAGESMSAPIRNASKRVMALSEGDLIKSADKKAERRTDEIGVLVRSLDSAMDTLEAYVGDISEKLAQMAASNLDLTISLEYKGSFAPIKSSLQQILDSLNSIMQEIRTAASEVASGSDQSARASASLAAGAGHQAATIQEFSSTLSQVSQMAAQNSQIAASALIENQKAEELMGQCMNAMQQTVDAMQTINNSSKDIFRVIKVIDDIAFQTNILALNAAVEAARAGQSGKGFAVVAEEVRNLAAKSAEAAKETAVLIEQSTRDASKGSEMVAHVDESLREIADIVRLNATQISQMDTGSRQQSESMEQVTFGINQISSTVQSNSATAEETAAASEEMSAQAAMLNNVVMRFHLKGQQTIEGDNVLALDEYAKY